jgi:hypothetical protein
MGKTGLELVKIFPDTLPQQTINEVVLKSMPMSAKEGDFASSTAEGVVFESYIFGVPGEDRGNIASLVAIYDKSNYDRENVRRFFSFTIAELKKHNVADTNTLTNILPNMYEGLTKGKVRIKISSVVTLDFDFEDKDKKEKDRGEEFLDSIQGDMWK